MWFSKRSAVRLDGFTLCTMRLLLGGSLEQILIYLNHMLPQSIETYDPLRDV